MRRLFSIPVLVLLGLSACDGSNVVSPTAPDVADAAYAKVQVPEFSPPEECDGCLVGPVVMVRGKKSPARATEIFSASDGAEAELVVYAPDPKHTTVKAWLNGATVLLPSAFALGGSEELRIPLTLAEENVLEVRLSGKPGTRIAFWVEGAGELEPETNDLPAIDFSFEVTSDPVPATADLDAVCTDAFPGQGLVPADWATVREAVDAGVQKGSILADGMAWIRWDGVFSYTEGMFGLTSTYYHVIDTDDMLASSYGSQDVIAPDLFWLLAVTADQLGGSPQRVLCMSVAP